MNITSPRPLIYINDANTVALIDIPTSIAHAQGTKDCPFDYTLTSTEPLDTPFQDIEPKTQAARRRLTERNPTLPEGELYQKLIDVALAEIRLNHHGNWCHPRRTSSVVPSEKSEQTTEQDVKRKRYSEDRSGGFEDESTVIATSSHDFKQININGHIDRASYVNATDSQCLLCFEDDSSPSRPLKFFCPPRASLVASDCKDHAYVHKCQRARLDTNQRQMFDMDMIIIDPPWPNRSARRNRGKTSYETFQSASDIVSMLMDLDMNKYLAHGSYVAVWVTNQHRVRDSILDTDGLFAELNVVPEEEWIWVKTTIHGEPVTKLDSLWRKPYEVLLIGRHWKYTSNDQSMNPLKRRIIASVPDLHSRKPCLKSLIERWLHLDEGTHRILEIFARNLVSRWDSWGLEVVKFQNIEYWAPCKREIPLQD